MTELLQIDHLEEPVVLERFHTILGKAWHEEEVPQTLKHAIIKQLYKKADRSNCNNTAGTRSSLTAGKVLLDICTNRLSDTAPTTSCRRSSAGSGLDDPRSSCRSPSAGLKSLGDNGSYRCCSCA